MYIQIEQIFGQIPANTITKVPKTDNFCVAVSPLPTVSKNNALARDETPFVNFSIGDYTITADWGLINGLRDFFNVFMSLVGILVFTAKSLINSLAVVFKLVGFILF